MSISGRILLTLLVAWGLTLIAVAWLGLTALVQPQVVWVAPRIAIAAPEARIPAGESALRAVLEAAGIAHEGALWTATDRSGPDLLAIELAAEDTRSLAALPPGYAIVRLGGHAAIRQDFPHRGALTERWIAPLADWRAERWLELRSLPVVETRILRHRGHWSHIVVLAARPRGDAAPELPAPVLRAPVLPAGNPTQNL